MANFGALKALGISSSSCDFSSLALCSSAPPVRPHSRLQQMSGLFSRNSDLRIFHQSVDLARSVGCPSWRPNLCSKGFPSTRIISSRKGFSPSTAQREDSDFEGDKSLDVENITSRDVTRQGSSTRRVEGEEWDLVQFQQAGNFFSRLPAFSVASALLALGLGLSFCKPAMAKSAERPPTVTATLNEKGEVEVQDRELEDVGEEIDRDRVEKSEEKEDEFEPVFGEGSDLTNDPTEVLLRSYLERHPTDLKALQALLYMRLKKGEINAAVAVIDKLIELEPDQMEWKFIRAQAFEFVGDLDQARQAFEEILELRPLSARALQGLAVVMQKNGEDEKALELLGEAVKRAVEQGQAKEATNLRMLLGQMHTIQGNLDEAMEQYRTVVEQDPQDYRPYLCQGLVYSIIGEEAEAEKQFRSYRKLCPKDFPHRGFLDELMLKAKSESRKLNERLKKEEEYKAKGKKMPKPMRQPLASGSPKKGENVGD